MSGRHWLMSSAALNALLGGYIVWTRSSGSPLLKPADFKSRLETPVVATAPLVEVIPVAARTEELRPPSAEETSASLNDVRAARLQQAAALGIKSWSTTLISLASNAARQNPPSFAAKGIPTDLENAVRTALLATDVVLEDASQAHTRALDDLVERRIADGTAKEEAVSFGNSNDTIGSYSRVTGDGQRVSFLIHRGESPAYEDSRQRLFEIIDAREKAVQEIVARWADGVAD